MSEIKQNGEQPVYVYTSEAGAMATTRPMGDADLEKAIAEHTEAIDHALEVGYENLTPEEIDNIEIKLRYVIAMEAAVNEETNPDIFYI